MTDLITQQHIVSTNDVALIEMSSAKGRRLDSRKSAELTGFLLSKLVNVYICQERLLSVEQSAALILLLEVLRSRDRRGDSIKPSVGS